MRLTVFIGLLLILLHNTGAAEAPGPESGLSLNTQDYFETRGLDISVFADAFPEGHQGGVSIIQHGRRVASNGDLRLEPTPGPWSPTPKIGMRESDYDTNQVSQVLTYPNPSRNRKGFNPIDYPDLRFSYTVNVTAKGENSVEIRVNLSKPLPQDWVDKVGFNLELNPKYLIGKSYLVGEKKGVFPHQAQWGGDAPLAQGKHLVIAPEHELQRLSIQSDTGITLWDGRGKHNEGWFIARSLVKPNATDNAIVWTIRVNTVDNWISEPVIQVSQVGYTPKQTKMVVIEQDTNDPSIEDVTIFELTQSGKKAVVKNKPYTWGPFLRYQYFTLDFSYLDKPGIYVVQYKGKQSQPFRISDNVFDHSVWQPTMEYFLPVQMCHMRVEERHRIWHDDCHGDDGISPPVNHNHFHGYFSGAVPQTRFSPGAMIPNLNKGGWHSGTNADLNLKEQLDTIWLLSSMIEEFSVNIDSTTINHMSQKVVIRQPDGIPDAIQQIEHGLTSTLLSYETMGRLYHGIIAPNKEQFTQYGELSLRTDGLSSTLDNQQDNRWVFVRENTKGALEASATFAAASRVLKSYNPKFAKRALNAAQKLYEENHTQSNNIAAKIFALTELLLSTNSPVYLNAILSQKKQISKHNDNTLWRIARILHKIKNVDARALFEHAVIASQAKTQKSLNVNPYKIPFKKSHRGIAKRVQSYGIKQYFLHQAWPQHVTSDGVYNAINFILGVHPGPNTATYVSGVGSKSALNGNGLNSMSNGFIPGGVISGTAIVQPNLPELLDWPNLKQQTGYDIATASAFMFLSLAANQVNQ